MVPAAVSDVVEGTYGGRTFHIIYGLFNTPINSIPGSAVCAFDMDDILQVFEGPFKEKNSISRMWEPVKQTYVTVSFYFPQFFDYKYFKYFLSEKLIYFLCKNCYFILKTNI